MMAMTHLRNFATTASLICLVVPLAGCAYRLPAIAPPSQELIRIVADAPEQYTVEVNTGTVREYEVQQDGRIKVGIPSYRPSCGVYLFDAIKVGGYVDPLNSWMFRSPTTGRLSVGNHCGSRRNLRRMRPDTI
jgi:hypothetical protein